jgi:hypothetical protein
MRCSSCALGILTILLFPVLLLAESAPAVSIELPSEVLSEVVQIKYSLSGAFGYVGGYIDPKPGLRTIRISASNEEGQAATAIKILVYAPGCDFMTFNLLLGDGVIPEQFVCNSLPKVSLSGRVPIELIAGHNAEIVVVYNAYWWGDCGDCSVTTFMLATVPTGKDGIFHAEFTDLSSRGISRVPFSGADLSLTLRDSKTWNHLATFLVPENSDLKTGFGLRIQSSYPESLKFVSWP